MLRGARPGGSVALIYTFLLGCAHYCHHGCAPPVRSLAEISYASLDVLGFAGSCGFLRCASLLLCFACCHLNDCMSSDA